MQIFSKIILVISWILMILLFQNCGDLNETSFLGTSSENGQGDDSSENNPGSAEDVLEDNQGPAPIAEVPPGLPPELDGLSAKILFEENFDNQKDFSNAGGVADCIGGAGNGCGDLPEGWTDFLVREWWNPLEPGFAGSPAGLQINGNYAKGGEGKSLVIWDESRGGTGTWGSDAMLGKYLPEGHKDIYAEFWIRFQPGYRWHHLEANNPPGQNMAKLVRIGHRDDGQTPFSFSASGTNAPLVIFDSMVWARDSNGVRNNIVTFTPNVRCDPQESNYKCGNYVPVGASRGYFGNNASFADSLGDGWHKLSVRMKLNSAPGVKDGIVMTWFDNELIAQATDVPFLGVGAPATHLLNQISFGGNMHNYPEAEGNAFEQWHAMDDIRIFALGE